MAEQLAGIDISNHQNTAARNLGRPIDWEAAARSGVAFCWVKATEDGGQRLYRDPYLQANVDGARAAGIAPGAYHFARPGDARLQARQFAEYAGAAGAFGEDALRAMLDVEDLGVGDDWIAAWIDEFRAVTGIRRVIVYSYRVFWQSRLHPDRWADDDVLLWLADYDGSTDRLQWNHPQLAVKQYSETGAVAGFPTRIDVNVTVNGYGLDALLIGGDDMGQLTGRQGEMLQQLYDAMCKPYLQGVGDVGDVLARLGRLFPDLDPAAMEVHETLHPGNLTNAIISPYSLLFKYVWPLLQGFHTQLETLATAYAEGRQQDANELVGAMRTALGELLSSQVQAEVTVTMSPREIEAAPVLTGTLQADSERPDLPPTDAPVIEGSTVEPTNGEVQS